MNNWGNRWNSIARGIPAPRIWTPNGAAGSTLLNNLKCYWVFNEASGNLVDSISGIASVPSAAITYQNAGPGASGYGIGFSGTQYCLAPNSAAVQAPAGGSFTVCCWMLVSDKTNKSSFVSKAPDNNTVAAGFSYIMQYHNTLNRWNFHVSNGVTYNAVGAVDPTLNTWYFGLGWWDAVNQTNNMLINNATLASESYTAGSYVDAGQLVFGGIQLSGYTQLATGLMTGFGLWNRLLNSAEKAELYNAGTYKAYPFAA